MGYLSCSTSAAFRAKAKNLQPINRASHAINRLGTSAAELRQGAIKPQ